MTAPQTKRLSVAVEYALGDFSLNAALEADAEPVAIVGPNGSGKTSLLLAILGIRAPDRGRIALADEVLYDSASEVDCPTEERRFAYLPQDFGLFPFLTAQKNVEFAIAGRLGRKTRVERLRTATECLERFGIAQLGARFPSQLSGGERQRVALARAIAIEPHALLLDEPTASLDVGARSEVRALLAASIRELSIPTLIVTHDYGDVLALAGRVAVIEKGRIAACINVDEMRRSPPTPFAARFLS